MKRSGYSTIQEDMLTKGWSLSMCLAEPIFVNVHGETVRLGSITTEWYTQGVSRHIAENAPRKIFIGGIITGDDRFSSGVPIAIARLTITSDLEMPKVYAITQEIRRYMHFLYVPSEELKLVNCI